MYTLYDTFYKYPYKKNHSRQHGYVKKKERSDHKYALDVVEYRRIALIYLQVIAEYLSTGAPFIAPKRVGTFKLARKEQGNISRIMMRPKRGLCLKWMRHAKAENTKHKTHLRFKNMWTGNIVRQFDNRLYEKIQKDPSFLMKFIER